MREGEQCTHYLYGSKKEVDRRPVATFGSEQQLLVYVNWATLKSLGERRGKFEQGSALASYEAWDRSLTELCDHIEQTHHAYLKQELPRLTEMVAKVVDAHGESHPELVTVKEVFATLKAELEPHMFKEEQVLFPAFRQLEQSADDPSFPFGTVANPIRMMEQEHDDAGYALSRLHALTRDYQVPQEACNTYRAMLAGLRQLERDMHRHVHKENSILFPRAIESRRDRSWCIWRTTNCGNKSRSPRRISMQRPLPW